ncbi:MAG: hypothetical protein ACLT16_17960 [[Clostridium] innocuum]
MKKKALLKDTLREIRKSFGRFFSIFAIVGIGVAFFAGVRDSVPVIKILRIPISMTIISWI